MRTDRQATPGANAKPALIRRPLGAPGMTPGTTWDGRGAEGIARPPAGGDAALPDLGWRPAREQPIALPAPTLALLLDGAAYDSNRHAVEFRLLDRDRLVGGELSLAALQSLAATEPGGGIDDSLIATFRRLADAVRRIAEWKYGAGRLEPDGRLQIATPDLLDYPGRRPTAQAAAPQPEAAAAWPAARAL
jgi:hypothetical protein